MKKYLLLFVMLFVLLTSTYSYSFNIGGLYLQSKEEEIITREYMGVSVYGRNKLEDPYYYSLGVDITNDPKILYTNLLGIYKNVGVGLELNYTFWNYSSSDFGYGIFCEFDCGLMLKLGFRRLRGEDIISGFLFGNEIKFSIPFFVDCIYFSFLIKV